MGDTRLSIDMDRTLACISKASAQCRTRGSKMDITNLQYEMEDLGTAQALVEFMTT